MNARVAVFVCGVSLLSLAAIFFHFKSANEVLRAQLAELEEQVAEVEQLRTENARFAALAVQPEEVEQLKKDAAEVHRLRNEVRTLQTEKTKLTRDIQHVQQAQNRLQQELAHHQQTLLAQQQQQQLQPAAVVYQNPPATTDSPAARNTCIGNLKQFDGATEQWALENRKRVGDLPTMNDLVGPSAFIRNMPVCPAGGRYTLAPVGQLPTCSISGHQLPQ